MVSLRQPDPSAALAQITRNLGRQGLQIVRSFDFQTTGATCEHGQCLAEAGPECQCQVTVYLVYGLGVPPATLIAHQHAEQIRFTLVNTPQQPVAPELEAIITAALVQGHGALPPSAE